MHTVFHFSKNPYCVSLCQGQKMCDQPEMQSSRETSLHIELSSIHFFVCSQTLNIRRFAKVKHNMDSW